MDFTEQDAPLLRILMVNLSEEHMPKFTDYLSQSRSYFPPRHLRWPKLVNRWTWVEHSEFLVTVLIDGQHVDATTLRRCVDISRIAFRDFKSWSHELLIEVVSTLSCRGARGDHGEWHEFVRAKFFYLRQVRHDPKAQATTTLQQFLASFPVETRLRLHAASRPYRTHLSESEFEKLRVKNPERYQYGTIAHFNQRRATGEVRLEDAATSSRTEGVIIDGRHAMNRAWCGDRVGVHLVPMNMPANLEESKLSLDLEAEQSGDDSQPEAPLLFRQLSTQYIAEVVGIFDISRRPQVLTGECVFDGQKNALKLFFKPRTERYPRALVPTDHVTASEMVKSRSLWTARYQCATSLEDWPATHRLPIIAVHCLSNHGALQTLKAETKALYVHHQIDCSSPEESALAVAEELKALDPEHWQISGDEISKRRDLRHLQCVSIDPEGARDADDAFSVELIESSPSNSKLVGDADSLSERLDGLSIDKKPVLSQTSRSGHRYRIGVHIADVSHFVKHGSALDLEAARRGSSVYLPDATPPIPMLPRILSNNACSLTSTSGDRVAVSVFFECDSAGIVVQDAQVDFCRSVIHPSVKTSYAEAQAHIDKCAQTAEEIGDKNVETDVGAKIAFLNIVANNIKKWREQNGCVESDRFDIRIDYDNLNNPKTFSAYKKLDSNALVAELMIYANVLTARHLSRTSEHSKEMLPNINSKNGACVILRGQPALTVDSFGDLHELCETCGLPKPSLLQANASDVTEVSPRDLSRCVYEIKASFDKLLQTSADLRNREDSVKTNFEQCLLRAASFSFSRAQMVSHKVSPPGSADLHASVRTPSHPGLAVESYTYFTSPIRRYPDLLVHRQLCAVLDNRNLERLEADEVESSLTQCNQSMQRVKRFRDDIQAVSIGHILLTKQGVEQRAIVTKIGPPGSATISVRLPILNLRRTLTLSHRSHSNDIADYRIFDVCDHLPGESSRTQNIPEKTSFPPTTIPDAAELNPARKISISGLNPGAKEFSPSQGSMSSSSLTSEQCKSKPVSSALSASAAEFVPTFGASTSAQAALNTKTVSQPGEESKGSGAEPTQASIPIVSRCLELQFRASGSKTFQPRRIFMFDEIPVKVVLARRNTMFSWNVQLTKW